MYYLLLIKLMYLIDREGLIRWGWSMTGDRYVSMDNGCVLSTSLNLITQETIGHTYWKRFVSAPEQWKVALLTEPESDDLSEAERALIQEIYDKFGHEDRWTVAAYTHELPEYRDPKGSSLPIDYADVLRGAGKSEQEVFEIVSELEEAALFEKVVG